MWFKQTVDLGDSDDKNKLISYTTGLISHKEKDDVNPEQCLSVGLALQKELDGLTLVDKMRVKGEVTNLCQLKKTVKLNDRKVVIDSMKLFNRLILIADRETTIEESLKFELTVVPMSLFDDSQMMRKANKAALGKYLKKLNDLTVTGKTSNSKGPLIIDGGWLIHQLSSFKGYVILLKQ